MQVILEKGILHEQKEFAVLQATLTTFRQEILVNSRYVVRHYYMFSQRLGGATVARNNPSCSLRKNDFNISPPPGFSLRASFRLNDVRTGLQG